MLWRASGVATVELWRVLREPSLSSSDEGVVELLSAFVLVKSIVAYPSEAFLGLSGGNRAPVRGGGCDETGVVVVVATVAAPAVGLTVASDGLVGS